MRQRNQFPLVGTVISYSIFHLRLIPLASTCVCVGGGGGVVGREREVAAALAT